MSTGQRSSEPLTDEQRRLVRENIGLVAVHLRRFVHHIGAPRRDREWEDLFQEGCLGLIQATRVYRAASGIPFAAFALPRIHNAVSRALQTKFATVYVPPRKERKRPARRNDNDTSPDESFARKPDRAVEEPERTHRPSVQSLTDEMHRRLRHTKRTDPNGSAHDDVDPPTRKAGIDIRTGPHRETVGSRLRGKYERAVRAAARCLSGKSTARGDRDKLVGILVEERFLIPDKHSRTALRQVARQTQSSYARVAQCDKQLGQIVRDALERDPEFEALSRRARKTEEGTAQPIDASLDRQLADASADAFIHRLRRARGPERLRLLSVLLPTSPVEVEALARLHLSHLTATERERLWDDRDDP